MENALLYMKVIAVIHGVLGYLGGAFAAPLKSKQR
jgi:hypothetical protein